MAETEVEIILFGVEHDGDLRIEYPELAEIEEFKTLSPKNVRLCWLLGNRTSPIYNLSKKERMPKALELVYGKSYRERKDISNILDGDIPEEIVIGIRRMESFNPEYRLRAKLMTQYMFEILNDMIILDSVTMANMDIDEKKKYTDLIVKVHDELPSMVKTLESSYGVKTVDRATKKKVLIGINDILR
jgi:hypothetical protein